MKTFMRCILIGVCVSLGYGLARASTQVSVDTLAFCFAPGESIKGNIIASAFSDFLKKDSLMILGKGTDTVSYKVAYKDFQIEFTGNGVTGGTAPLNNIHSAQTIGTATGDLKKQYIQCTVTYTRNIQFEFKEPFFQSNTDNSDSLVAYWKHDLFGEKGTDLPTTVLQSKRSWRCVVGIRKSLTPNETFVIEGNPCMVNGKTALSVPEEFADIHCVWKSEGNDDALSDSNAHTVTVTRVNGATVETTVHCELTGCSNEKNTGTIRLLPNQTPASTISLNDCLPTTAENIEIVATNPLSGVRFQWGNVQPMIAETTPSSQKIVYPVSGETDFTVTLITQGGCNVSQTTRTVHRKLSDNVKLQVLDNCLASGMPFRVVTDPPLIGMPLRWMAGQSDYTVEPIEKNRQDRVRITRDKPDSAIVNITVMDTYCRGGILKSVSVSEAYTGMTMRTEAGARVSVGDKVPSGTKIIFTAPQHSSITGLYGWSTSIDGGLSKSWNGPAEISVTAPDSGSLTVSVSYTSCFGRQSKTYRLQATNGYCTLLEE